MRVGGFAGWAKVGKGRPEGRAFCYTNGMRTILLVAFVCVGAALAHGAGDRMALAAGLARRGLTEQAAKEYEAILADAATDPATADDARFGLAGCREALGRGEEARTIYRDLAGRLSGERQAAARIRLAVSLATDADRPDEARTILESLATEAGASREATRDAALYYLGLCYERLGRDKDAASIYALLAKRGGAYARLAEMQAAAVSARLGDTASALATYRRLLDAPGADAEARGQTAACAFLVAYAAKDYAAAAAFAQTAGAKALGREEALLPAAYAALQAKKPEEARAWLAAAKLARPAPTPERLLFEGSVNEALGDEAGALTAYERVLAEFPGAGQAPTAARAMLAIRSRAGDPAAFLKAWGRVAATLPAEARAELEPLRLDAATQAKDLAQARAAAAWLMENAAPDRAADAGYRLGWLENTLTPNAGGETWLRTAERWPKTAAAGLAAYAAAYAFTQARQPDRADRALALALASGNDQAVGGALLLKAQNALAENDAATAAPALDEYLARFPDGPAADEAAYLRGIVFFNAQDFQAAERALARALAGKTLDHARRVDAALRRAQCLHALGRGDEAAAALQPLVALKDAATLAPAYLRWLAEFRLARREWGEAEAAARALAMREETAPADRALGQVLLGKAAEGQGQAVTARAAYEAALRLGPAVTDAEAAAGVGRLAAAAGDAAKAREAFALAAERADPDTDAGRAIAARAYAGLAQACATLGAKEEALRANLSVIIFFDDPVLVPAAFRAAIAALREEGRDTEAKSLQDEFAQRYPEAAKAAE